MVANLLTPLPRGGRVRYLRSIAMRRKQPLAVSRSRHEIGSLRLASRCTVHCIFCRYRANQDDLANGQLEPANCGIPTSYLALMTSTVTSEPAGRAAITVEYQSKRSEVWRWYWRSWARLDGLWRFHALWGLMAAGMFAFFEAPRHVSIETFLAVAIAAFAVAVALFPLWPLVRFKSETRSLTIDPRGFKTKIGKLAGERSWCDVRSVEDSGDAIVINGTNRNALLVPRRAFANECARRDFLAAARDWHSSNR
jgi:hypothetical protein